MPIVNLGLHIIADRKQLSIARTKVVDQRREAGPERVRGNAGSRQCLLIHKISKLRVDLQALDVSAITHHGSPCMQLDNRWVP